MVMGEQTLETQVSVIGGGPGGYAAAFRAADLGLDVTLINEEESLGGMCLHRGCIPSKALRRTTEFLNQAHDASSFGVQLDEPQIDIDKVRSWVERVIRTLARGLAHLAKQRDIQVIHGRAVFESSKQLRITGAEVAHIQFKHAIIATGSTVTPPPGMEFQENSRVMDPGTALHLPEIPDSLLVVGGSYSGLEIGSRYAQLGSRVTIVEMLDSLLPGTDPELVKPLERKLKQLFEAIHVNTKLAEVKEDADQVEVTLEGDVETPTQSFDRVVICTGCRPNSQEIGLENTKVKVGEDGFIKVDAQRRTDDPHIFAVGDVVGGKMLAHKAMYGGKIAAEVIADKPAAFDARAIPCVVYTDPEVAWCGLSELEAKEAGYDITVARFPWSASGRALTVGTRKGLTKIVFEADTERVLGVGIVGPGAEDLIAEGALAVEMGALAQDLALTVHPHPTLSETIAEAAEVFLGTPTDIPPDRT